MKIYFGIFGVRLVFLFIFHPSGVIKKTNRLRAVPERDTARGQPLNSAAPNRPSPSAPPRSARAAGAAAAAADDPAARGSSRLIFRAEKKIGVRRFSFSQIKSAIFLFAIPDSIFVLV